jgi:predicted metal-binding protein
MDREKAGREFPDVAAVEAARANAPSGPTLVSVCITCKTADGATVVGPDMFESVKAAIGSSDHVLVRPVQCLSVCKRPATVAVTSADGYTFLFGDLQTESGTAALVSFVKSYQNSGYGLVPWRERADVLRKGMVARVPPMRWSPDDGSAPK